MRSYMWTPRNAMKGILFSWILSALFAMPQLFVWNLGWSSVLNVKVCIASFSSDNNDIDDIKKRELAYILYFAISQFLIPFCILVYLYVRIFMTVSESVSTKKSCAKNKYDNSFSTTDSVSFPSSMKDSKYRFRSSKKSDSLNRSTQKDTIPMLALPSVTSDAITVTSSCVSIDRETKIRQNISKRSLSMLSKSKIKTFKLTLSVVAAFAFCTLPFFTVQITLATVGKPETISNETLHKISCIILCFNLFIFWNFKIFFFYSIHQSFVSAEFPIKSIDLCRFQYRHS